MIKALLGGGMYLLFVFGILMKWKAERKPKNSNDKAKGKPSRTAYEQIDDPIQALGSTQWQVRLNAIQRLLENPTPDAIPAIITALEDSDPDVRQGATDVLIQLGTVTLPQVFNVLENGKLNARIAAVQTLTDIQSPDTLEQLSRAVREDESVWVRLPAIEALARYPSVLITDILIRALHDENHDVYDTATMLLRKIGTPDALQAIDAHPYSSTGKSRNYEQLDN